MRARVPTEARPAVLPFRAVPQRGLGGAPLPYAAVTGPRKPEGSGAEQCKTASSHVTPVSTAPQTRLSSHARGRHIFPSWVFISYQATCASLHPIKGEAGPSQTQGFNVGGVPRPLVGGP